MKKRETLKSLARGFGGRTMVTAKLAGKLGLSAMKKAVNPDGEAAQGDESKAIAAAEQLLETLDGMKGLPMKFGQMASYLEGSLPPAAQAVLSKLQSQSSPLEFAAIDEVVQAELGASAHNVFDAFEEEPFAAASIGQVHRAEFGGRAVAVKVQYPEMADVLASDVKTVSTLTKFGALVGQNLKEPIAELRQRMLTECDYVAEAENQVLFRQLLAERPGAVVPEVIAARSTGRVLCTALEPGLSFEAFNAQATQAEKDKAGGIIFDACFHTLFHRCVYNADPHPGNYLFRDGEVVFLDYGCVKHFKPEFIDMWKRMALSVIDNDRAAFDDHFYALGMVKGKSAKFDYDAQWECMQYLYEPFTSERFTYTHEYVGRSYNILLWKNKNRFRMQMPGDWLFLNRLQWGLNSVLAHLAASAPWPAIWRAAVESPTDPPALGDKVG